MLRFLRNLFTKIGTTPETARRFDENVIPPYLQVSKHYQVVSWSIQDGEFLYLVCVKENAGVQHYMKGRLKLPKDFRVSQVASASHSYDFVETGFRTSSFHDSRL